MPEMDMEIESGFYVPPEAASDDNEDGDYDGDFFVTKGAPIPEGSVDEIEV